MIANTQSRLARFVPHIGGMLLLIGSFVLGLVIWIAVQSTRAEPLPTLVWAAKMSDSQVMAAGPVVLDRLGQGWWWVYATPKDRDALRSVGAQLALAMPTPLAQMAGCSVPAAPVGAEFSK
jgi:hypothetical protein